MKPERRKRTSTRCLQIVSSLLSSSRALTLILNSPSKLPRSDSTKKD